MLKEPLEVLTFYSTSYEMYYDPSGLWLKVKGLGLQHRNHKRGPWAFAIHTYIHAEVS